MGIPEWFLEVDSRKTKLLYDNACVQIVIHFRGPIAARLEQVSIYSKIRFIKLLKLFSRISQKC